MIKLYDYFRSTACYRVRIALHIKNIDYETVEVHLLHHGGEQNSAAYHQLNPQGLVPTLEINGQLITQSLAIIHYLEEIYPAPPLLPTDPQLKALAQSLALSITCDVHPLNNLRVLNHLKNQFQADETQVKAWYHYWLKTGFDAFEKQLMQLQRTGSVCLGTGVSLADVCLIPQVYNAHRFDFSMTAYPLINEINAYCLSLPAFQKAAPDEV